jgi:hypothetical protein
VTVKKETNSNEQTSGIGIFQKQETNAYNSESLANRFNKYFLTVADSIISSTGTDTNDEISSINPLNYLERSLKYSFPKIQWRYTSINEINKIITSLKSKNSLGYDNIPLKVLKISAPFIISTLVYIRNRSLSLGILPERLKYSIVKPVFKKGDRGIISNYWPISLLTSLSKILESLYV